MTRDLRGERAAGRPDRARIREQAVDWALRLDEADPAGGERDTFEAWIAADPAHAEAFRRAESLLGDARTALADDPVLTRRLVRGRRRAATAVIALGVLLAGAGGTFLAVDGPTRWRADLVSAKGETPVAELPDGSRVFLNADSAIAETFDAGSRRVVLLRGEAYFEVRPDPSRPFVVEAGAGSVRVLGTAFDVDLVDGGAEVTVTEHTVSVRGAAAGPPAVLRPGQRVVYDGTGALGPVRAVPAGLEVPWRSGRLVFEEQPVSRVLTRIARHVPGEVLILGYGMGDRPVTGSFDLSDPPAALASFAATFGLRVARAGGWLTVIY